MLDTDEHINEGSLASTDVFGRLEDLGFKMWPSKGIKKDTDREENANTCKMTCAGKNTYDTSTRGKRLNNRAVC